MIESILIANRGEIALRVIRTARAMGIRTVAVYSDADASSPHVLAADAAVRLGPAAATESYLNVAALLTAAREAGADAVHPGYGFLSENAGFARACQDAGLSFIGPPADVISALGRKDAARELAEQADVPVLRSYRADEVPADVFPVLVKAASGGGGKGMRIVRAPAELPDALKAAEREAESAFGDGTVLVERYLEHGRHVEVQILADGHGNVVHLGERDCSVQRRHQKVVEESPAPTISRQLRERLLDAAVRLCRKVGYVNAGTVEFIVSGDEFFFLEVNTRLQVEHSVTELVTGLDLVALQIKIARGERLPQLSARPDGHAIEVRVYAEDAEHGFLPQAGVAGTGPARGHGAAQRWRGHGVLRPDGGQADRARRGPRGRAPQSAQGPRRD
jgi:acetyl/propionyl-CoA carboxylase alpha subunit